MEAENILAIAYILAGLAYAVRMWIITDTIPGSFHLRTLGIVVILWPALAVVELWQRASHRR